jgi:hypothetical protein
MEPYRLREWKVPVGRLFTCGRPGRSKWKDAPKIPEDALHKWTQNLPEGKLVIISLLGRKPDGTSEYSFYPFHGGFDTNDGSPTFETWLQKCCPGREIVVREHPTVDFQAISSETLQKISADIRNFLELGATVVLVDSGGETRTGKVCTSLGLQEKFTSR